MAQGREGPARLRQSSNQGYSQASALATTKARSNPKAKATAKARPRPGLGAADDTHPGTSRRLSVVFLGRLKFASSPCASSTPNENRPAKNQFDDHFIGGQFDFGWASARAMPPPWGARADKPAKSRKSPHARFRFTVPSRARVHHLHLRVVGKRVPDYVPCIHGAGKLGPGGVRRAVQRRDVPRPAEPAGPVLKTRRSTEPPTRGGQVCVDFVSSSARAYNAPS